MFTQPSSKEKKQNLTWFGPWFLKPFYPGFLETNCLGKTGRNKTLKGKKTPPSSCSLSPYSWSQWLAVSPRGSWGIWGAWEDSDILTVTGCPWTSLAASVDVNLQKREAWKHYSSVLWLVTCDRIGLPNLIFSSYRKAKKNNMSLCYSPKIVFLFSWETHDFTGNAVNTSLGRIWFTKAKEYLSPDYIAQCSLGRKQGNCIFLVAVFS